MDKTERIAQNVANQLKRQNLSKEQAKDLIQKLQNALEAKGQLPEKPKRAGRKSTNKAKAADVSLAVAKRKDGSFRQMVASTKDGQRIFSWYFTPGTIVERKNEEVSFVGEFDDVFVIKKGKKKYHWSDSFVKEELNRLYDLNARDIFELKQEAAAANKNKKLTHIPQELEEHCKRKFAQ